MVHVIEKSIIIIYVCLVRKSLLYLYVEETSERDSGGEYNYIYV